MQPRTLLLVEPRREARARMREAELPARERQRDLAVVHVSGEDELERARRQLVEDMREVTEENPQAGVRIDELPRPGAAVSIRARIDADELNATSAHLDRLRFVDEQSRRSQIVQAVRTRERVTRMLDIVVAEHCITGVEPPE